jgi:chromatin-remodeling ATPase INO80
VCNHPELFERADVVAPFSFSHFGRSGPLNREGDFLTLSNSSRNPIEFDIPELFYVDGCIPGVPSESRHQIPEKFKIWSAEWIHHSLCRDYCE